MCKELDLFIHKIDVGINDEMFYPQSSTTEYWPMHVSTNWSLPTDDLEAYAWIKLYFYYDLEE